MSQKDEAWKTEAERLHDEDSKKWTYERLGQRYGKSPGYIAKVLSIRRTSRPADLSQLKNLPDIVLKQLQKEQPTEDICKKLKISERILTATLEDLKESGFVFVENGGLIKLCKDISYNSNTHTEQWNGELILKRAIIGDTHLSSKTQQLTHLNTFYDMCQAEGITEVLHAGDVCDGDDIYPGHKFEVFNIGADAQKEYAIKNYPKREGIVTKYITGNHDLRWFTQSGYDIGTAMANERPDMIYLGQYYADVQLTDKCILRLEHPLGKPAYAVSYKTQRKIDNMRGGEKPNILVEGHYHYSNYMFRRNVHAFNVPSFQGPTKFSNRLGLENENGGYILEIHVDEEGTITKLKSEFVPFYKVIKDDY